MTLDHISAFIDTITYKDLMLIPFLVVLETVLSIDNALVLALLVRNLPPKQQRKALTYGLVGAFVFRLASLLLLTWLVKLRWIKLLGGLYLIYLSLSHFLSKTKAETENTGKPKVYANFWRTVAVIELTDIAFAVDSIIAAVGITTKLWIVFTGGFIGVVVMRYAASLAVNLLDKFPRLESTAYQLVFLIGTKVILEVVEIFESLGLPKLNFHDHHSYEFWIFWVLMTIVLFRGFIRDVKTDPPSMDQSS